MAIIVDNHKLAIGCIKLTEAENGLGDIGINFRSRKLGRNLINVLRITSVEVVFITKDSLETNSLVSDLRIKIAIFPIQEHCLDCAVSLPAETTK
jgi:hypothetical protein